MNNGDLRLFWLSSVLLMLLSLVDAQLQQVRDDGPTVSTDAQWQQHNNPNVEYRDRFCGHPDVKANCEVNTDQSIFRVGSTVEYVPRPGYTILENNKRECGPNGTWSGEAPHCGRKVSVGKSMNCSIKDYVEQEHLIFLVDGKESPCAVLQRNRQMFSGNKGHQDVELTWRMDLFEEYVAIKSIRLLYRGGITFSKVTLESSNNVQHVLAPNECATSDNQLQQSLREFIIVPKRPRSARYIQFITKLTSQRDSTLEFCEAEVYDIIAPSVEQCLEETVSLKRDETTIAIHDHQCYTFDSNNIDWKSTTKTCDRINGGTLAKGLTSDIYRFLINFSKANTLYHIFWVGGKSDHKPAPRSQSTQMEWQWINGEPVDQDLMSYLPPNEDQCLTLTDHGWRPLSCTKSFAGVICQTAFKKCSSPQINVHVIVDRYNYSVGEVISHRCPEGMIITGDEHRQCMAEGQWSGSPPECLDQNHPKKESQKDDQTESQEKQIPEETILGVIIAAVIVGIVLIAIVAAIIISRKRGGRFKKKIHFHKESMKDGESVATCDDTADCNKGDTSRLNESQKENYNTVNPEFTQEQQQQEQQTTSP